MKRIALLPISFLVFGCSAHHAPAVAEAPLHNAKVAPVAVDSMANEENPYLAQSTDARSVGDWVTTEFQSNGKTMTVQQRVLSRDGAASIVEVAIKDGQ